MVLQSHTSQLNSPEGAFRRRACSDFVPVYDGSHQTNFWNKMNMTRYSTNKDINKYVRNLVKDGWVYEKRSKHGVIKSPSLQVSVMVNGSPSCNRAFTKFKKDIERAELPEMRHAA